MIYIPHLKKLLIIILLASCAKPQTDLKIFLKGIPQNLTTQKLTISISCGQTDFDTTFVNPYKFHKILKVQKGKKYYIKISNPTGVGYVFERSSSNGYDRIQSDLKEKTIIGYTD